MLHSLSSTFSLRLICPNYVSLTCIHKETKLTNCHPFSYKKVRSRRKRWITYFISFNFWWIILSDDKLVNYFSRYSEVSERITTGMYVLRHEFEVCIYFLFGRTIIDRKRFKKSFRLFYFWHKIFHQISNLAIHLPAIDKNLEE